MNKPEIIARRANRFYVQTGPRHLVEPATIEQLCDALTSMTQQRHVNTNIVAHEIEKRRELAVVEFQMTLIELMYLQSTRLGEKMVKFAAEHGVHREYRHEKTIVDRREFTDPIEAMRAGRRWCYELPEGAYEDAHGFVPSLVVEGVAGHFPMLGRGAHAAPWYWGKTIEEARLACQKANAQRGVSVEDAAQILSSSIEASIISRRGVSAADARRFHE